MYIRCLNSTCYVASPFQFSWSNMSGVIVVDVCKVIFQPYLWCVLVSRSVPVLMAVYFEFLLTSIGKKQSTHPVSQRQKEKLSFFLVYIILITWVDLDLAKKSSDVLFWKEPLLWIAIGQLLEGVKVLKCVLAYITNSTIAWCRCCIIAKHIYSNKLW